MFIDKPVLLIPALFASVMMNGCANRSQATLDDTRVAIEKKFERFPCTNLELLSSRATDVGLESMWKCRSLGQMQEISAMDPKDGSPVEIYYMTIENHEDTSPNIITIDVSNEKRDTQ